MEYSDITPLNIAFISSNPVTQQGGPIYVDFNLLSKDFSDIFIKIKSQREDITREESVTSIMFSLGGLMKCNARCIYCRDDYNSNYDGIEVPYERIFDFVEFLREQNVFSETIRWVFCLGEFTINPFKNKFLNLVRSKNRALVMTNGIVYDKKVAAAMKCNQDVLILTSLDSGTPQTWDKVKRGGSFLQTIENIAKYRENANSWQIQMKYILLPEINTNAQDYQGLLNLMKSLELSYLQVDCDNHFLKKGISPEVFKQEIKSFEEMFLKENFSLSYSASLRKLLSE